MIYIGTLCESIFQVSARLRTKPFGYHHSLMAPQLKRRGVAIDTEIEYRVGPYFVLAVNIISIDWTKLIKYSHRLVSKQNKQWIADQGRRDELREELLTEERKQKPAAQHPGALMSVLNVPFRLYQLTKFDVLAQFLACMYYVHWTISIPVCWILFRFFIQSMMHKYILATVADGKFIVGAVTTLVLAPSYAASL
jgi:hypothetical protein